MNSNTSATNDFVIDYETFHERYRQEVLRYLVPKCANRDDAEELTQEIFTYCWRHFPEYDRSRASYRSWLYIIVISRWKNYCRDRKTTENIDDFEVILSDDKSDVDRAFELQQLRDLLAKALEKLSENARKVIIMHYFLHKDFRSIAETLNISESNARQISKRALASLKEQMNDYL